MGWSSAALLLSILFCIARPEIAGAIRENDLPPIVVLVKVGGSSITEKNSIETLNDTSLSWLAQTLSQNLHPSFLAPKDGNSADIYDAGSLDACDETGDDKPTRRKVAYIVVHGAGSFGHFHAKKFGLEGISLDDKDKRDETGSSLVELSARERSFRMQGLAQTRRSVQKLNQLVVSALVDAGINAVSVSPAFGALLDAGGSPETISSVIERLKELIRGTLRAGLVPVLHGDACLFHGDAGILSGDTLVDWLADETIQDRVVFLTDVAGVFTSDPKRDTNAALLPWIGVQSSKASAKSPPYNLVFPPGIFLPQDNALAGAQASSHEHDVTGGLATKLKAALDIVHTTKLNVTIAKFGSISAEQLLQQSQDLLTSVEGTVIFCQDDAKEQRAS